VLLVFEASLKLRLFMYEGAFLLLSDLWSPDLPVASWKGWAFLAVKVALLGCYARDRRGSWRSLFAANG